MKTITIHQEQPCKKLGDLFGIFFEDINHAADVGLYAEMVQNRSFEFCEIDRKDYHALTAWEKSEGAEWTVKTEKPLNQENLHYLEVKAGKGDFICNTGFSTGMFLEAGKKYDFSVWAMGKSAVLRVSVKDENGDNVAENTLSLSGEEWQKYELVLEAEKTTVCGKLYLIFEEEGTYAFDMVSLFPQYTFRGRKGGLRRDIAEALEELHPKFMRFPGGCLTHDGSLDAHARNSMYRWYRTLGKTEERPSWRNNWGYNQTLGLGFYEYFLFCEDIGAKPLPVVPGGFNPHKGEGVPLEEIEPWVQETLDLIEFANGDVHTKMGAVRAEMGHPESFHLEYIGIGNEEIGEGFFERYPYFHKAIRENYPDIKIINTSGSFAMGEGYEAGWNSARKYGSDLVDEHYYSSLEWFLANMHHYEDYDEKGPKVFLGEYASWGNTFYNALVEAAYMTHLERARAVALACYAPMLCNVDYVNWKPDMLWFHNHGILKTPNYYVQKLFMQAQGTDEVILQTEGLDEILPLSDKNTLSGEISVTGNDIEGRIWNITVTDCETGAVLKPDDIQVAPDNRENRLTDLDSNHYVVEFSFQRSSGRKGLKIFFGKNADSMVQWEFGGWDNWDCNITSIAKGRGSVISHRIFHVEDMEYRLKLEVTGRHIQTWINGVLWNDTVDRLPELEELYLAASVEKKGDGSENTYLKAVNLTGEAKTVKVILTGVEKKNLEITSLTADVLTAENTFDCPDRVKPVTEQGSIKGNQLEYTFPAHSVTVLKCY